MIIKNVSGKPVFFGWIGKLGLYLTPDQEVEISDNYAENKLFQSALSDSIISVISWDNSEHSVVFQKELDDSISDAVNDTISPLIDTKINTALSNEHKYLCFSFSEKNKDYIYTANQHFKSLSKFIYMGSNELNIQKIKFLVSKKKTTGIATFRIYDLTNVQQIVSIDLTNRSETIIDTTIITNLPTNEAIFDIQAKLNEAHNQARLHYLELRDF